MKPICTAFVATTLCAPAAYAAPVDLIATFDATTFSFAPEETVQQALDYTNGQNGNPFNNDISGGFMSPQTGDGPDTTDYANGATERELREDTFVDGLPYGGAQWNGANNSGTSVPIYVPGPNDPYAGSDFVNKWVLPTDVWEFDEITARFVLESDDFDFGNVAANINNDIVDASFSLLDADVNTLFESDTLGSLFRTNSGDGALVRQTAAAAFNSTGASIDGDVLQENDILVIAAIEEGNGGPNDPEIGLFATVFVGDGNWFETVFSDGGEGNLLASLENPIYDLQSELYIEERRWGTDQNGYVPLGTFEIVGQGTGLTTETSGSSEQSALLPDADTTVDGGFAFEVAIEEIVNEEGIVWIDPDIATGYVYQATQNINGVEENAVFTAVQAPGLTFVNDQDGYTLTVTHIVDIDGNLVELPDDGTRPTYAIAAGEIVTFNEQVGIFKLTGIDESLMLDPENGAIFQTGLGFQNTAGLFNITQTPITTFVPDDNTVSAVPLPMPALMLLTGLGGLVAIRRRRKST